jgi:arylformamidase
VLVFIHGGYWRSLDKSDHSFVAPPLVRGGACVVVPNYALCPAVTVPQIAMQMVQALLWVHAHIARLAATRRASPWRAIRPAGHLAALLLACQWPALGADLPPGLVRNALSISGLYDLEPIRHTPFLQPSLRLTPQDALRASPACMPAPRAGVLYTVAGGDESAEFLRHNELIRKVWGKRTVPVCEALAGLNHFSVLDALAQPGHRLHALARAAAAPVMAQRLRAGLACLLALLLCACGGGAASPGHRPTCVTPGPVLARPGQLRPDRPARLAACADAGPVFLEQPDARA